MYMIKLHASDLLKTSQFSCSTNAKLQHESKLQIGQTHFQNFVCTLFLQFGLLSTCNFSNTTKLHLPFRLVQKFCCLWKLICAYSHQIALIEYDMVT